MRKDPKNAKGQQLVFFDDWPLPQDRLKGTTAVLRKLASIAEQAKAAGVSLALRPDGALRIYP
jgi:hypothetical protein